MELLLSLRNDYLPPVVGSSFKILAAIKKDDYSIDEAIAISAEVTTGVADVSVIGNEITVKCVTFSNVIITIKEPVFKLFTFYSFRVTNQQYYPQLSEYQNLLNSEMPGDMFEENALDTPIWAQGAINTYGYIQSTFKDIFPNLSTNINWLYSLWSSSQQFYYTNPDFSYQKLFVFLRNLKTSCTLNPFDQAWHISYFIYLISGIKTYVYIKETRVIFPFVEDEFNVYIFSGISPANAWILDQSELDVNTYLDGISIYSAVENSIDFFVSKIYRTGKQHKVVYNDVPATFGLTAELNNVYKGDPRLNKTYCIAYEPNNFTLASGLVKE